VGVTADPVHRRVCHDVVPVPVLVWDEPHPVYGTVKFVSREVAHLCPECFEPVLSIAERLAAAREAAMDAAADAYDPDLRCVSITKEQHDEFTRLVGEVEALEAVAEEVSRRGELVS
jgi:hypothetical protein